MEGIYKSPVIKEEKLEVKRGSLEMPKDSKLSWRKLWKTRYFVFCEVKKGESRKLPLYFYKSRSAYMADELPEGLIDLTDASEIGMIGHKIGGHEHIISMKTPNGCYYVSAASCADMFNWIIPLRSYRFNDESEFPSVTQIEAERRSSTWDSSKTPRVRSPSAWSAPEGVFGSPQFTTKDYTNISRNEKLRKRHFCNKCQKIKEEFQPEDTYGYVRSPDAKKEAPKPKASHLSSTEDLYEVIPDLYKSKGPEYINLRPPMPLPSMLLPPSPPNLAATKGQTPDHCSSSSDSESQASGGSIDRDAFFQHTQSIYVGKGTKENTGNSTVTHSSNEYEDMRLFSKKLTELSSRRSLQWEAKINHSKFGKTLSIPNNINNLCGPTFNAKVSASYENIYRSSTLSLEKSPNVSKHSAMMSQNSQQSSNDIIQKPTFNNNGLRRLEENSEPIGEAASESGPCNEATKRPIEHDSIDESPYERMSGVAAIGVTGSSEGTLSKDTATGANGRLNKDAVIPQYILKKFDNIKFEFITDI
eukprot:gene6414-11855_t